MFKDLTGLMASIAVGQVVNNIVEATMPNDVAKSVEVVTRVGAALIGSMAGAAAAKHTGEIIDEITAAFDVIRGVDGGVER